MPYAQGERQLASMPGCRIPAAGPSKANQQPLGAPVVTPCVVASELKSLNTLLDARNAMVRPLCGSPSLQVSISTPSRPVRLRYALAPRPTGQTNFCGVGSAASNAGWPLIAASLRPDRSPTCGIMVSRSVRIYCFGNSRCWHQTVMNADEVVEHRLALRIEAQAALVLPIGARAVIGDEAMKRRTLADDMASYRQRYECVPKHLFREPRQLRPPTS